MATDKIVIPVIDLANFPVELKKLASICTGLGCFRVVNHGISPILMEEMKVVARSLFELPAQAKLRSIDNSLHTGGYVKPSYLKFYESFSIYDASSKADIRSFCSALNTTIQQREIISEYIEKLHDLIVNIACKVAESMGYNLSGHSFDEWSCLARLHSYNFMAEEDIGCIGIPTHTDTGFLTLLQEDESVGGFEIMNSNGKFVAVDPVPHTFVINIGDVGKVWSNGRLHAVKHRVACKEAKQRISLSMLILAAKDDRVEPEATFVDSEHPKIYQTFNYKEYRKLRDASNFRAGEILPLL